MTLLVVFSLDPVFFRDDLLTVSFDAIDFNEGCWPLQEIFVADVGLVSLNLSSPANVSLQPDVKTGARF